MAKETIGGASERVSSVTGTAYPGTVSAIAEKVLASGQATLEESKSLAATVLEQDRETQAPNKEISAIAEKVFAGSEATLQETRSLAAHVLGQIEQQG
jgi:hypothetical protein